jgi:hypothetical protein
VQASRRDGYLKVVNPVHRYPQCSKNPRVSRPVTASSTRPMTSIKVSRVRAPAPSYQDSPRAF